MQLPSTEQVYKLMKQAQVMQFDELHDHVPSVEPAALVELLLSCARVIDGCWVVKSDRLFDSGANVWQTYSFFSFFSFFYFFCRLDISYVFLSFTPPHTRRAV